VRVLGVDLAWRDSTPERPANETGVVAVDQSGVIVDAGWTCGVAETVAWMSSVALGADDGLAMIDASLVVENASGQRLCETQVGQRYGRWKVSANSTNLATPHQAGATLLRALEAGGWRCHDGDSGPPRSGRWLCETYPYATLVGAPELGYDVARPVYKRKPRAMEAAAFRPARAAVCDDLIARVDALRDADPPIDIRSHPVTAALVDQTSPLDDRTYKHREDLLDAVLCAWTGLLWLRHGITRCQVLGDPPATIIVPARPEQRR
jgi:predicted RNase H-like nuclease